MIFIGRMTEYDLVTYCIIKVQYFCSSWEDVQWNKMQILKTLWQFRDSSLVHREIQSKNVLAKHFFPQ